MPKRDWRDSTKEIKLLSSRWRHNSLHHIPCRSLQYRTKEFTVSSLTFLIPLYIVNKILHIKLRN